MRQPTLPELHFCEVSARRPIIQGGMGVGISGARLASAVANQGGIGVISAVALGVLSGAFRKLQKGEYTGPQAGNTQSQAVEQGPDRGEHHGRPF